VFLIHHLTVVNSIVEAWFAPSFLEAVPTAQIGVITAKMKKDLGSFREVRAAGGSFETVFEGGVVPTEARLDAEGRLVGLFFRPPKLASGDVDALTKEISSLPGKVSLFVSSGGKERFALRADEPLAVGSAFKLAILAAVDAEAARRKSSWDRIVRLTNAHKSLPTGKLQTWPEGTPLTIGSLATLMIAESDNTATDELLAMVGRDAVEVFAPHARPLLSTRQRFVLTAKGNDALLARYRAADVAGRRAMLAELDMAPLPALRDVPDRPTGLDVEWSMTARELCGLLEKVAPLPLFSVNPGLASADRWDRITYKGGSEPGVLNFSTRVEKGGVVHCVVATWNHEETLENDELARPYARLLASLGGG
jgi:beta-lactamase class A